MNTQKTQNWMLYACLFAILAAIILNIQQLPQLVSNVMQSRQSIQQPAKALPAPAILQIQSSGEIEVEYEGKPYKVEWTGGLGECSWQIFDKSNPLKPNQWDQVDYASAAMSCQDAQWLNLLFSGKMPSFVDIVKKALGL